MSNAFWFAQTFVKKLLVLLRFFAEYMEVLSLECNHIELQEKKKKKREKKL
jgi:hypothetical protein